MFKTSWTGKEFRAHPRKEVYISGAIDLGDGSQLRPCKIADVSKGGARLIVLDPWSIPDKFSLLLAQNGSVQRRCKVAWRSDREMGVQYLSATSDCEHESQVFLD